MKPLEMLNRQTCSRRHFLARSSAGVFAAGSLLLPGACSLVEAAGAVAGPGFRFPIGNPRTGVSPSLRWRGSITNDPKRIGHLATDYPGTAGQTPIYLAADAKITYVKNAGTGWDNVIIAEHNTLSWGWNKNVWTMYAHVTPVAGLKEGLLLPRGTQIAVVGPKAAGSTNPHLHFEVRSDTQAWNTPGPGYAGYTFNGDSINGANFAKRLPYLTWHNPEPVILNNLAP